MKKHLTPFMGFITLLLLLLPLCAYWSLWNGTYINFDDYQYLAKDPVVRFGLSAYGVFHAFTNFAISNWHPLTWISHMVDFDLFGVMPGAHHIANVVVHCLASITLFAALTRTPLSQKQAAFVAFIFALHPLQVESVAWLSQRKATLSGFFGFCALFTWLDFTRNGKRRTYWYAVFFFCLSLLSKSAFITLPAVFMLIDLTISPRLSDLPEGRWRPLRRFALLVYEKAPFWLLCLGSAVMTIRSAMINDAEALFLNESMPHSWRLFNAIRSCADYIRDFLIPRDFSVFYPMNDESPEIGRTLICLGVLTIISLIVFRLRRSRPFLMFGWLWFLGVLLPMSGLVQTGYHARANRFMYLPIVGLAIMITAGINWSFLKRLAPPIATGIVALLGMGTYHQAQYWHNDETLFAYSGKNIPPTRFNLLLAAEYFRTGRKIEGLAEIEKFYPVMLTNRSYIIITADNMAKENALEEARELMARAAEDIPESPEVWVARARLVDTQDKEQILKFVHHALEIDPKFGPANYMLAKRYMEEEKYPEALRAMALSDRWEDRFTRDTRYQLGIIYEKLGNVMMAQGLFKQQLKVTPSHLPSNYALGILAVRQQAFEQAVFHFERVYKYSPELLAQPHLLAFAYGKLNRFDEAVNTLHAALKRNPDDLNSRILLAKGLARLKDKQGAVEAFRQVLERDPENKEALDGLNYLGVAP